MACCASSLVGGCAYPMPNHLCLKVGPQDPKMTSLGNGNKNVLIWVEQAISDEK
jgi:hypothetical protein